MVTKMRSVGLISLLSTKVIVLRVSIEGFRANQYTAFVFKFSNYYLFFKNSILSKIRILSMLTFFEVPTISTTVAGKASLVDFTKIVAIVFNTKDMVLDTANVVNTGESVWPSLRWQERECSEMLNISFIGKRDTRSLFLSPLLDITPLSKSTPTSGFYEMGLCHVSNSLVLTRSTSS